MIKPSYYKELINTSHAGSSSCYCKLCSRETPWSPLIYDFKLCFVNDFKLCFVKANSVVFGDSCRHCFAQVGLDTSLDIPFVSVIRRI